MKTAVSTEMLACAACGGSPPCLATGQCIAGCRRKSCADGSNARHVSQPGENISYSAVAVRISWAIDVHHAPCRPFDGYQMKCASLHHIERVRVIVRHAQAWAHAVDPLYVAGHLVALMPRKLLPALRHDAHQWRSVLAATPSVRFLLDPLLAADTRHALRATGRSPTESCRRSRAAIHVKMANRCNRYPCAASGLFNQGLKRDDNDEDP